MRQYIVKRLTRYQRQRLGQSGGASLVATAVTGVLIAILTVSLTTLMTGELRQAIDLESSVKSYYAAESGAELTTLYVKNFMRDTKKLTSLDQACEPGDTEGTGLSGPDPFLDIQALGAPAPVPEVTCVSINAVGKVEPLDLRKDETYELDLTGLDFDYIEVSWGQKTTDNTPATTGAAQDPRIEATVTNFDRDAIDATKTSIGGAVLDPTINCGPSAGSSCTPKELFYTFFPIADPAPVPGENDLRFGRQRTGEIDVSSVTMPNTASIARTPGTDPSIGLPDPYNSVLRLTARQKDARVQIRLFDGSTELNMLPLQNAQIDVTARVGSAFRRVRISVPVKSSPLDSANVLYADSNICKDQEVLSIPGGGGGGAPFEQAFQNICPIQ